MKTLKHYIFEKLNTTIITEKFQSSIIRDFINKINDVLVEDGKHAWSSNNYYVSLYGIINGKSAFDFVYMYGSGRKHCIKELSQKLMLSDFKDEWIKSFDDKSILSGDELKKLFGDCEKIKQYNGLNKWAQDNATFVILFHKPQDYTHIGEPLFAIFINPEKGNEVLEYWKNVHAKQNERKSNNAQDHFNKVKMIKNDIANKAIDLYLRNSSTEQGKTLKQIANYFISGPASINFFGGGNKENNKDLTLDAKQKLRNAVINWLFMLDGATSPTHALFYTEYCNNQQRDTLDEFWKDLQNRFTIDNFELKPKKEA